MVLTHTHGCFVHLVASVNNTDELEDNLAVALVNVGIFVLLGLSTELSSYL
ncbi:hypothetical protein C439_06290 [Haloferax mediterranei ATCC 33500]|uniref:Uncharacterized protein n=1 Tax=Haloferax mediterranei (strain ATCC 33500 / DSM 1411 / JCM 8866 / NBRC 14739 / NCIMB 2177 / R-4) TaxID=523841 RepID=I3R2U7_HALMT|nr:hypothetical protein HFX_0836 [Haloferax mediterranei ATCC 33500]EMA02167.1 hypothetical protein C439_06290 [Haloferax mediterranei ATCC 33500]